jgi:hypothetical protein
VRREALFILRGHVNHWHVFLPQAGNQGNKKGGGPLLAPLSRDGTCHSGAFFGDSRAMASVGARVGNQDLWVRWVRMCSERGANIDPRGSLELQGAITVLRLRVRPLTTAGGGGLAADGVLRI